MPWGFFGNLIFVIIARMLCGNHLKYFLELHNELLNTCSIIVEAGQELHKLFFVFHQDFMDMCCFIGIRNKHLQITKHFPCN